MDYDDCTNYPRLKYLNLDGNAVAVVSPLSHVETQFSLPLSTTGIAMEMSTCVFQTWSLIELKVNTVWGGSIDYIEEPLFMTRCELPKENTRLQHLYVDGSNLELVDEAHF
jgi:Leucine-rich repeat (LRR) protein